MTTTTRGHSGKVAIGAFGRVDRSTSNPPRMPANPPARERRGAHQTVMRLGYLRSVQRFTGGNTGGEHPSARGVPLDSSALINPHTSQRAIRARRVLKITTSPHGGCRPSSAGGALRRPPGRPLPERSPIAIPWRERPREMAAWPAKPAARMWSLTPRWRMSAPMSAVIIPPQYREVLRRGLSREIDTAILTVSGRRSTR